jgi:hypothetical protein
VMSSKRVGIDLKASVGVAARGIIDRLRREATNRSASRPSRVAGAVAS